jgi:hypothetical protein
MDRSPEKEVEEVLKKAQDWYHQTFEKKFDVIRRYDKFEEKWTWQITSHIGGGTRAMQFGLTKEFAEGPFFGTIVTKLLPWLRTTLVKAHARWEPTEIVKPE